MKRGRPNPRLVKIHRSYTVEEIARLLGVHKNTVRAWLKDRLPAMTERRPVLVLGLHLVDYLLKRRAARRQTCAHNQIYCVRCRKPREPAGGMVDYIPITMAAGNLRGMCPQSGTFINRRARAADLSDLARELDVKILQPVPRI